MFSRRDFFRNATVAAAAAATGCSGLVGADGIIDTHTHFYDPTRPAGVSWPPEGDPVLHRPVLPSEYRRMVEPLGVAGTVVVEASPRDEDNEWILDLADRDPFLLGFIGFLHPGRPGFRQRLEGLALRPKFRGIRVGGWNEGLRPSDPAWIADLERVAELGLTVDLLVGPKEMPAVEQLAARIPRLSFVVDHCANIRMGPPPHESAWVEGIVACHYRDNVFMKISGLVEGTGRTDGTAPRTMDIYRPVLDTLWRVFGEDRLMFGSNWPVSSRFAPFGTVLGILDDYLKPMGQGARRKVLTRNAARIYGLQPRRSTKP